MKLYHGSNLEIKNPQILESDRKLDFGTGFYLTSSYEQAEKWAILTAKRRGEGRPIISVFEYEDNKSSELNILKFENADIEWLRFVSGNRNNQSTNIKSINRINRKIYKTLLSSFYCI